MKQNKSVAQPLIGMQRDILPSQLKPSSYTLGININTQNEIEGFAVQNEPSNYFGVQFPDSYKVVSFIKNPLKNRTYYFLTSTESNENSINYKKSSIGFVDDTILEAYNQDDECGDCGNEKNILSTP